jgi:hypothetical protein
MFFVLKFELILIIGSNNVLTEGARKVYRGRRVGQGCCKTLEPSYEFMYAFYIYLLYLIRESQKEGGH